MAKADGVLSCTSQTLMIRDWWMCMIISVMFEFLEYSLEHQLPNFSECWWDHVGAAGKAAQPGGGAVVPGPEANTSPFPTQWIMDVLICNGLGIYCGMKTLEWLSLKTYKWQGLWNIPTYKYILGVVEGTTELWAPKHRALLLRRVAGKMVFVLQTLEWWSQLFLLHLAPGLFLSRGRGYVRSPLIQPRLATDLLCHLG